MKTKARRLFEANMARCITKNTYEFITQLDWEMGDGKWICEQVNAIPAWDKGESAKGNAN